MEVERQRKYPDTKRYFRSKHVEWAKERRKGKGEGKGERYVLSLFGHPGCGEYFKRIETLSYGFKVLGGSETEVFWARRPMAEWKDAR